MRYLELLEGRKNYTPYGELTTYLLVRRDRIRTATTFVRDLQSLGFTHTQPTLNLDAEALESNQE